MNPEEFRIFVSRAINEHNDLMCRIDEEWNLYSTYTREDANSFFGDLLEQINEASDRYNTHENIYEYNPVINYSERGIKGIENLIPFRWYDKYYKDSVTEKLFYIGNFSDNAFLYLTFNNRNLIISKGYFEDYGVIPYVNEAIIIDSIIEYNETNYLVLSENSQNITYDAMDFSLNMRFGYSQDGCERLINDASKIMIMLLKIKQYPQLVNKILKELRKLFANTHN